ERGTARVCIFAGGIVAWGALAITTAALASTPVATFVPLVVLAGIFEAVFSLHVGVERIGRYLQVFYESAPGEPGPPSPGGGPTVAGWEQAAMAFGGVKGVVTTDALFTIPFALAAFMNIVPALVVGPTPQELIFVGGGHALFIIRLAAARSGARRQRAVDLARFEDLRATRR